MRIDRFDDGAHGSVATVLVVDGDADTRDAIATTIRLEVPGVRVDVAGTAEEALRVLQREPVAVLIAEYQLPGLGGLVLIREAVKLQPRLHVFSMTGHTRRQIALQTLAGVHIDEFWVKPLDAAPLLAGWRRLALPTRGRPGRIPPVRGGHPWPG